MIPITKISSFLILFFLLFAQAAKANTEENQESTPTFDIWEFRVNGNTVLDNRQIESAVYPFLGPKKSFADVQAAQQALGEIYKEQGYSFANILIPEQDVDNGVVNLNVVEGKVSRVKISGNKYFSRGEIRKKLTALEAGQPADLPKIQEQLARLNRENPNLSVVPIARPGKDPETVEIELRVKDELPFRAGFELNGRNSPDTSRTRASVNLGYSNLWQKNHNLSTSFQTTPEDTDEVQVISANYSMPIFNSDNRLLFYWIDSDSDIATVNATTVVGSGRIFGIRGLFPIFGNDRLFQSLSIGIESKDFDQTATVFADSLNSSSQDTPIRYTSANADYTGFYRFDKSTLTFGAGVRLGLRGLGNSLTEFESRRIGSRNNFVYLVSNATYNYIFENDLSLSLRGEAQFTGDPLIGNEQYSSGGQFNVRGYLTSQELTDEALFASIELSSPDLSDKFGLDILPSFRTIAFFDYADLHNRGVLPGEDANINLAGVGVGVRANLFNYIDVNVDIARALSDSSEGSDSINAGHTRTHFTFSSQF